MERKKLRSSRCLADISQSLGVIFHFAISFEDYEQLLWLSINCDAADKKQCFFSAHHFISHLNKSFGMAVIDLPLRLPYIRLRYLIKLFAWNQAIRTPSAIDY